MAKTIHETDWSESIISLIFHVKWNDKINQGD